jgi:VIT1/CCC1 family predicted Fe2+/Mn2+ transporter
MASGQTRPSLFKPAIFGLGDGCMSLIGELLYVLGDARLIVPVAISGAISNALSMGGNEYLSDSDNGLMPSVVMGGATAAGAFLPALPFLFFHGATALFLMALVALAVGIVIGWMRGRTCEKHTMPEEMAGTLAIFAAIALIVLGVSAAMPSPAG